MPWIGFWLAITVILVVGDKGYAKIDCALGIQPACTFLADAYAPKKD